VPWLIDTESLHRLLGLWTITAEDSKKEDSMATARATKRRPPKALLPVDGEQRFRFSLVDYPTYVAFGDMLGERHVRVTYANGEMEFMTLSKKHEQFKTLLGAFVETLVVEMDIDMTPGGSMTFQRADLERGLEPDECYWIAHEAANRNVEQADLTRDPPPDLVIEVEISRSSIDRMEIYRRLRVPEVWRFDGTVVHFEILNKKGRYEQRERSKSFPFLRAADLNRLLAAVPGQSRTKLLRHFRTWIQDQIAREWKP
jgi:Uma2 family endonuclease